MKTPFFPALRPCLAPMGTRTRSNSRPLAQATLSQIEERLSPALDPGLLQKPASHAHSRDRVYSLSRTFWCWIWQVLQANTSCRQVVCQVQALFVVFTEKEVDEGTAAYCCARKKLPSALLEKALVSSASSADKQAVKSKGLQCRPLKFVDASGLRVADTPQNQKTFPSSKNQHEKPSFPMMKLVALFSAASGAILAKAIGSFHQSELRLLMSLRQFLAPGDILTGDRAYSSFVIAAWLQTLSVDLIAKLSSTRKVDFRKAWKRFGRWDGLFIWRKPSKISPLLSREQWDALPEELTVRIIRVRVDRKGFRTRELTVTTTLLDAELYPSHEILEACLKRWRMEMCLDDLKTTLGMEMLNCRSPELLEKELLVFLTSHNLLRWMMARAAQLEQANLERLSFKGSLDAFRQWANGMVQIRGAGKKSKQAKMWRKFFSTLAADLVPLRPGRREPRAVKKRSKYPPLSKPRDIFADRWSRNKRRRVITEYKNKTPLK